jgi:flagellar basal-body rod modification protein FlgD
MSVSGITNVNQNSSYSAVQNSKVGSDKLDMKDFFTLLAAQLSNQDMNEPVESTEFISQMAQFSALAATQEISSRFENFMAASYIGKNIKAMQIDSDGVSHIVEGVAQKVEFINGETFITVGTQRISPDKITEVSIKQEG